MVKPRRWIDVNGSQVPEIWEAGLRAVIGTIVSKPAISQVRHQNAGYLMREWLILETG
jgi:hypothetical protein